MRVFKKKLIEATIVVVVFSAYLVGAYIDQQDELAVNATTHQQQ